MTDSFDSSGIADRRAAPARNARWLAVCLLLLGVTWGPLLGLHVHRMSLSAAATGPVIAVFPPTWSSQKLLRKVMASNGAPVRRLRWFRNAWVVQSPEPGFVGRLKDRGAWGVYALELLSADVLFNCLRTVAAGPVDS